MVKDAPIPATPTCYLFITQGQGSWEKQINCLFAARTSAHVAQPWRKSRLHRWAELSESGSSLRIFTVK